MPTPKTTLTVRRVNDQASVIDIHGEVTAATENGLMDAYAQAGKPRALVLNFTGLEYMNSSGIGLLVTLLIRANRQKQKVLAYGLSEHYQQIFTLTRLNEAIRILESEADALAAA